MAPFDSQTGTLKPRGQLSSRRRLLATKGTSPGAAATNLRAADIPEQPPPLSVVQRAGGSHLEN